MKICTRSYGGENRCIIRDMQLDEDTVVVVKKVAMKGIQRYLAKEGRIQIWCWRYLAEGRKQILCWGVCS
jgi:hypothetical protein